MKRVSVGRLSEHNLRRELREYHGRYPKLGDDELFVLWFLRAFVTENEANAAAALCGASGDKGVDAVLVDAPARVVVVVQGKYRKGAVNKIRAPWGRRGICAACNGHLR